MFLGMTPSCLFSNYKKSLNGQSSRKAFNIGRHLNKPMKRLVLFLILILSGCNPACNEERVELKGNFDIIQDKYQILIFETESGSYWVYESPEKYKNLVNQTVEIKAIKSPPLQKDPDCNICHRECPTCQCPIGKELLYDIEINKRD